MSAEGRWRAEDCRLRWWVEQLLAGVGGIGAQAHGARSLEHQIARGGHRPAVPRGGIVHAPCDLAGSRVEGDQAPGRRGDRGAERLHIVGQHRLVERGADVEAERSEEHTSDLQSLMRTSYDVFCLKKKKTASK